MQPIIYSEIACYFTSCISNCVVGPEIASDHACATHAPRMNNSWATVNVKVLSQSHPCMPVHSTHRQDGKQNDIIKRINQNLAC